MERDFAKKKLPNQKEWKFIDLAQKIRNKNYPQEGETNVLSEYYQLCLAALEDATREQDVIGFDTAWEALSEDNEKLKEWKKLLSNAPDSITSTPPKTLINFAELRKRPKPSWVIQDFIYENTIIELYAEAGCYKSFLAFDWAARIATGTDWLGHIKTHKSGAVVYIAAEGADGYINRGDAWCSHNNISFDDLARNFYFWPDTLPLTNAAEVARFIDEVTETLQSENQPPRLIIIDTLLRCSNGENINSPDVMGSIFMGAARIKSALNVPNILIVHHAGKNAQLGGMGSVVLKNNCDCIYFMSKDVSTPGQVVLKAEKMKDKAEPQIILRSQKIYYGDMWDEENASLVLIEGEKEPENQEKPVPDSQRDLLEIIQQSGEICFQELFNRWKEGHEKGRSESNLLKILRKLKSDTVIEQTKDKKWRLYIIPKEEQKELLDETLSEGEEDND
jgi:RecA-family ATPase